MRMQDFFSISFSVSSRTSYNPIHHAVLPNLHPAPRRLSKLAAPPSSRAMPPCSRTLAAMPTHSHANATAVSYASATTMPVLYFSAAIVPSPEPCHSTSRSQLNSATRAFSCTYFANLVLTASPESQP